MNVLQKKSEIFVASCFSEKQSVESRIMEIILGRNNMQKALKRVPGVNGMTVEQLPGYLKRQWVKIRNDLLYGKYKPLPVRRKEILKP